MLRLTEMARFSALIGNLILATTLSLFHTSVPQSSSPSTPASVHIELRSYEQPDKPIPARLVKRIPSDTSKRCPQFEDAFRKYGLQPVEVFSYIAWRESGCRIKAINATWDENGNITWTLNKNGSYDSGLLQVNSSWKSVTKQVCGGGIEMLLILDCNLKVSKYLLDNGGLGHWSL